MSDMAIGFNSDKANELIDNIKDNYRLLKDVIIGNWQSVQFVLHNEWVGEDEISFEKMFAQRINNLYKNSASLVYNCCKNIKTFVNDWKEFQENNVMNGSNSSVNNIDVDYLDFDLNIDEDIIIVKTEELELNTDRGLRNINSADIIQNEISEYVESIKKRIKTLFDSININSAFFGDQVSKLDEFIETIETALGEVLIAVKDLNDSLSKLAGTAYNSLQSSMLEKISSSNSNIDRVVSDLNENKWG